VLIYLQPLDKAHPDGVIFGAYEPKRQKE